MPGTVSLTLLDQVRIASPCSARWEDMVGDERVRHCAQCNLNVHNFSAISADEAEALLAKHVEAAGRGAVGRVCAAWFKRADGTAIFQDCPRGLARLKAGTHRFLAAAATLCGLTTFLSVLAAQGVGARATPEASSLGGMAPVARLAAWLRPPPPRIMVMGDVYIPPPGGK